MNYFEKYKSNSGFYITKTKTFRKINNNHHSELDIINTINDYCFIKATGKFRIIDFNELVKFNYAVYYFYLGDIEIIKYNIEILNKIGITYLTRIVDIKHLKKIKIK